jgi:hypothetical protein
MQIVVRQAGLNQQGVRSHYCQGVRQTVGPVLRHEMTLLQARLAEQSRITQRAIGWTAKHPAKGRLVQLQAATEKTLELLGYTLGTVEDEHELHTRFAAHRVRGEWFQPAQEILTYFQENQP